VQSSPSAPAQNIGLEKNFEIAGNNEIVPFCLPIPRLGYMRDHTREQDLPRGSIAFEHKVRKADSIEIQGLLRSDTETGIAEYCRKSYAEGEEPGKAIEQGAMNTTESTKSVLSESPGYARMMW
jgi:hypothetical protein